MRLVILQTNDLHGKLTPAAAEQIASLRQDADFYFDSGDCISVGNLGIPRKPDPAWELLRLAGCDAGVPGNREFHVTEKGFRAKLAGSSHPVLAANLRWRAEGGRAPLQTLEDGRQSSIEYRSEGDPLPAMASFGEVGVFGLMIPMVTSRMAARHISAFLNEQPTAVAHECIERLRASHKIVICLSHLGLRRDAELAQAVSGIDLILGGHSHTVLEEPLQIGDTWICQTGSHARFVGRYELDGGRLKHELLPLVR